MLPQLHGSISSLEDQAARNAFKPLKQQVQFERDLRVHDIMPNFSICEVNSCLEHLPIDGVRVII